MAKFSSSCALLQRLLQKSSKASRRNRKGCLLDSAGATGMFENGSSIRRCRKFVDEQRVRPRSGRSRRKKLQDGSCGSRECQTQPPSLHSISNSIPSSTISHYSHATEIQEAQLQLTPSLQPISSLQQSINSATRLVSIPDSSRNEYLLGM
uniref:Uncharacterized protein n=1 Tax=Rodentolepis nana TaxID=102285 RepID=A0A0R3TDK2_RODNA